MTFASNAIGTILRFQTGIDVYKLRFISHMPVLSRQTSFQSEFTVAQEVSV